MKTLLSLLVVLSASLSFADTSENCAAEAEKAAFVEAGDPEQNAFTLHSKKFLGKLELPDLLDTSKSDFFESYYFVLSSDSDTTGVTVTTRKNCSISASSNIGSN